MSLCANVRRLGLSSRRLASDPARARLHQPRKLLQILVPEEVILVRCGDYSARKGVFAYERPGKTVIVTCVDAACSGEESVVQTSKAMRRNWETLKSDIGQFFRSAAKTPNPLTGTPPRKTARGDGETTSQEEDEVVDDAKTKKNRGRATRMVSGRMVSGRSI